MTEGSNEKHFWSTAKRLLDIIPSRPEVLSGDTEQVRLARRLAEDAASLADALVPSPYWKADASCGKGQWASLPWVAIFDERETTQASKGAYVVIHLMQDQTTGSPTGKPGIRLGFGISATGSQKQDRSELVGQLVAEMENQLDTGEDFGRFWLATGPQPRPTVQPAAGFARACADGLVLERFVPADEVEARADELTDDLTQVLTWYRRWVDHHQKADPIPPAQASKDFFALMREYQAERNLFTSPRGAVYEVVNVGDDKCTIRRLSTAEPTEDVCTAKVVRGAIKRLQAAGGSMPVGDLAEQLNRSRAVMAAILQAPCAGLTADRASARLINNPDDAASLLRDYLGSLRVDRSTGAPKLYKPAMVDVVLAGIESGEVTHNRIDFDWLAGRFRERMAEFGQTVTDTQAAMVAFHLSSEPFWLLSYQQGAEIITTSTGLSADGFRSRIRQISIRQPFWETLQAPSRLGAIRNHLQQTWWPSDGVDMNVKLDEGLLARAAKETIRPWLIDKRKLDDTKAEGYHHQQVIPRAQPHLTREALEADAVGHVTEAIKASANLLSQYEHLHPVEFLAQVDAAEARTHLLDLLHGDDPVVERIRHFLDWGGFRKGGDGRKIGFNGTIVSYLLAMSNPAEHAFCKPEVYRAAALALLGPEAVVADPAERIEHATALYRVALALLKEKHALPFTDLMHVHISFYIVKNGAGGYPNWEQLRETMIGRKPKRVTMSSTNHLNLVLYGPPGTGKTYNAVREAVRLCDGQLPDEHDQVLNRFRRLQEDGRIGFVTFHQSYGYEDFMEGISPAIEDAEAEVSDDENSEGGDIRYQCRDGVFKKMCNLAKSHISRPRKQVNVDPAKVAVWKMSLGNTADPEQSAIYDECLENNYILLGYGDDIDFSKCNSRSAVHQLHLKEYGHPKRLKTSASLVHALKHQMKIGDLVVISDGNFKFRAIGRIAGDYQFLQNEDRESYRQMRPVEWLVVCDESLPREKISTKVFSQRTIHRLNHQSLKLDALRDMLSAKDNGANQVLPYVLIIDEINRGNISKILGELITLLEPDKRLGEPNELKITLPYSGDSFGVPANLHVLGTMNTADRSIAFLDVALRRRFVFREMMPELGVIRHLVGDNGRIGDVDVAKVLETINRRIELLFDRDHQIGHSYLLGVQTLADLRDVFVSTVIPLLQEYFYEDWAKVCAVLGCPYDSETGKVKQVTPIIQTELLSADDLLDGDLSDMENRVRCHVSSDFCQATDEETLEPYFHGVTGRPVKSAQLLANL
ncbi:MrcB family domain-containing protein [Phycisphaerales bacterium AB-hyl4]|uniref:MrcB family domain-containing protein n=1 Tax=Natronomicrosphaera hydrolytica TaxID=3242702 RepID=A0ABV4U025_9BACT